LITRLKKVGVDKLLHKYNGIIVGRSAGALALASQGVVTNRYNKKVTIKPGLGLAKLCLKTHYEPSKDDILKKLSDKQTIHALPSGSAIVYNHNNFTIIGQAYMFRNYKKHIITEKL
jgi:peptidase E